MVGEPPYPPGCRGAGVPAADGWAGAHSAGGIAIAHLVEGASPLRACLHDPPAREDDLQVPTDYNRLQWDALAHLRWDTRRRGRYQNPYPHSICHLPCRLPPVGSYTHPHAFATLSHGQRFQAPHMRVRKITWCPKSPAPTPHRACNRRGAYRPRGRLGSGVFAEQSKT